MKLTEIIKKLVCRILAFAKKEISSAITTGLVKTKVYSIRFNNTGKAGDCSYHQRCNCKGKKNKTAHFRHSHVKGI